MKNKFNVILIAWALTLIAFSQVAVAQSYPPPVSYFYVTEIVVQNQTTMRWSASVVSDIADSMFKRYRVYVFGSEGGMWTQVRDNQIVVLPEYKNMRVLVIGGDIATATNPRSFYYGPGIYTIRFEVEDMAGNRLGFDQQVKILPPDASWLFLSLSPESTRRTAFRSSDFYRIVTTRQIENRGKSFASINRIVIIKSAQSFVDLYVEIDGARYATKSYPDYSNYVYADVGIRLAPGSAIKVALVAGRFLTGAVEARADIAYLETDGAPYEFSRQMAANHAVVDWLPEDGLSSVKVTAVVSPENPATMSFTVKGQRGRLYQVLLRAIGPSLGKFGIDNPLADPNLRVFDGNGNSVAANEDWIALFLGSAADRAGAFTLSPGSLDAAIMISLTPGDYSVVFKGSGTGKGTVRVEAYQVPHFDQPSSN